ncbi:MAG: FMN-binding domain protein [Firmicutes bacterium ADurb.Bin506]|jgi:uncharacterized protein with FMN-binding domain|nr:MAG: FMN-binding domain protein [Firmicutes bacterium ADurb.Bin506]
MGWAIVVGIVALIAGGAAIGMPMLLREHAEARRVALGGVDFSRLKDGKYVGEYAGGMYKWRANKVQVEVSSGKVTDIKPLGESGVVKPDAHQAAIYPRVIEAQSLEVDMVSGATLTCKAYLKAVEDALKRAQG